MIRRGKETIYEINAAGELVKKFRDRDPHPVAIAYTEAEKNLYEEVSAYTGSGWAQLSRKRKISPAKRNVGKFLLSLVQKRMVSSPAALRETLRRRIDSIVESRTVTRLEGSDSRYISRLLKDYDHGELMEDEDRELVERYIETRRLQTMYAERTTETRTLRNLLEQVEDLLQTGQDSKLAWLENLLRDLFARSPDEKVIIFTEYRDTLNYLKSHLEKKWFLGSDSIVIIHGGMPLGEDDEEIGSKLYAERRFNDADTRLLLATDAASEGLNLQRHCHILINYELPWNPNRLEQRIGRIHRYGQRYIARIYNLMIAGSKEAEIFRRLQEKIEIIRQQLGSMAEVLGVLERVSLDDVILRALDRSVDLAEVGAMADEELRRMEEIAESIRKTQFLSGCRQFTHDDIRAAEGAIAASQQAIPGHKDVQAFVETFLRVFGDQGHGERDGRKLHPTKHKGVHRVLVPSVIQDDKLPRSFSRVTFERVLATRDWSRSEEPEFLAFGHPLLERMVHYCRVTRAAELGGKLAYMVADYAGLPGVIFNFLLRFEDNVGRVIREELEPVFVDLDGVIQPELGRQLFLGPSVPQTEPHHATLAAVQAKITALQQAAEHHIRAQYQEYYKRVESKRNADIAVLLEDLERFDCGTTEHLQTRLVEIGGAQRTFFEEATVRGQRTRMENQLKMHQHRMQERRQEVENMRLGIFPAPELLNMVVVTPA
jgi:hypothetical protein